MSPKQNNQNFLKDLVIVALVTVFVIVSNRFILKYYTNYSISPQKTIEYSSQRSQDKVYSSVVE